MRSCSVLLTPFIPDSCEKIFAQIGAAADCRDWDSAAEWGRLSASVTVHKGEAIFPRIDMEKALADDFPGLTHWRDYKYGKTAVTIFRKAQRA